jgi:hypothetical protein
MATSIRATGDHGDLPELHRLIIDEGVDALSRWFVPGADLDIPARFGRTPLMTAIAAKDFAKIEWLLRHGADPEKTDDYSGTALAFAVNHDFVPAIELLIRAGVDRGYTPKYPPKPLRSILPKQDLPMPEELRGAMSEEEWREMMRSGMEAIEKEELLIPVMPLIGDVQSLEALRLFLDAGDRLGDAPGDLKRQLLGIPEQDNFTATKEDFLRDWRPTFGETNPQRIESKFLRDMVLTGKSAYGARAFFTGDKTDDALSPVWCNARFGASLTELPDGRYVQIGGEHEDHYDPDFRIYNDVIVFDGRGGFEIYGYPKADFPPTDFHTATLVGDQIYVIGSLGYPNSRKPGMTPVFRFDTVTWRVTRVATSGAMPGWIYKHLAVYDAVSNAIRVWGGKVQEPTDRHETNRSSFLFDFKTFVWRSG